jgi:hypothetical protein
MPKSYGARGRGIQQGLAACRISPVNVIQYLCRIDLGPSRRDPQGTISAPVSSRLHQRVTPLQHKPRAAEQPQREALQGASAMGGSAVSEREFQPSGLIPRSTAFDIGATVLARTAHANRAFTQSARHPDGPAARMPITTAGKIKTRRCTLQNWTEKSVQEVHG